MKIHKEGYLPIAITFVITGIILALFITFAFAIFGFVFLSILLFSYLFIVIRFFRVPKRKINKVPDGIISPADGQIVIIEKCIENEYFKDERIKISIFMSINNVHVNNYPIDGKVTYVCYHPGKYLVAKLPKASFDNEHNTVVVQKDDEKVVLFRQIAGLIARRIVSYAQVGKDVNQGEEMGIIRFGSRVDLFLPLDAHILVNVGDKVRAKKTVIANF